MGDEEKIQTMLKAFKRHFETVDWPEFNEKGEYFMIKRGNTTHETVSDAWEFFKTGWYDRENVDERTVEGWS